MLSLVYQKVRALDAVEAGAAADVPKGPGKSSGIREVDSAYRLWAAFSHLCSFPLKYLLFKE